jgi:hypothetical protein
VSSKKRRGNPAWTKGVSGNPSGGARKAAKAAGTDGVASYMGYLRSGEDHRDLRGSAKWLTYSNAMHVGVVATGIRFFLNLLGGTKWSVIPDEYAGKEGRKAADIVQAGLIDAPMMRPWPQVVRKAALYRLLGFSLHACAMRRRKDGIVVFSAIEHRPQHTIEKWHRANESAQWTSVTQRSAQTGKEIDIPLDECWLLTDDTLTDSPEGVGVMRHVIELVRRLGVYEDLEGKAYAEDLGGMPIGRAPLAEIELENKGKTAAEIQSNKMARTAQLRDSLSKRLKEPEVSQWLLLDSDLYTNPDGSKAGTPKWGIEMLRSETVNLPDINTVIGRLELQIARVLGTEFTMMGGSSAGSYSMHEDKTTMFATNLQATLDEVSWSATMQLARRLVARNGIDPDATPQLVAEPIATENVLAATQALANLTMAGLRPDDPVRNVIRDRLRLPAEPEGMAFDVSPRLDVPRMDRKPLGDVDDPTDADGTEEVAE